MCFSDSAQIKRIVKNRYDRNRDIRNTFGKMCKLTLFSDYGRFIKQLSVQIVLIPVVIKTYVFTHYPDVL